MLSKALKVISLLKMTKDEVITATEYHFNKFCQTPGEWPIFLGQLDLEFSIKDVYKTN